LTVFVDPDAPVPLADEEIARLQAAVKEAIAAARASDLEAKAQRLAGDLVTTQAALAAAQQTQKDALKAARRALAEGNDPAEHEQRYAEANRQETVLANRISALSYLAEEGRRAAAGQARQAAQRVLERARQDITDRRRQRLAEAVKALDPHLPAIGALDRVEYELSDFKTGGLPTWAEALLNSRPHTPPPDTEDLPAVVANDDTPSANDASARRRERIRRILEKRRQGLSLRDIAKEEKVGLATVQRDLEAAEDLAQPDNGT
jgi:hypothetical protein